ncbi:nuclear transport factor 2 family protein [Streptomyces sp. NPDC056452]|uniref:nuclear transport factor 2 family protein n=1 Tax=Streptomyces sp. NPDC056452 TaxID=3345821 RepID=UPI0036BB6E6B
MSQDVLDLVQRYIGLWNETDDIRRRELAGELFTGDGDYIDPNVAATGPEDITVYIGQERKKFGDLVFSLGELIGSHHGTALFSWKLGPAGVDAPVARGYDAVLIEDGRLRQVHGFFA